MNVGFAQPFRAPDELAARGVGTEEATVLAVILVGLGVPPGPAGGITCPRVDVAEHARRAWGLVAEHARRAWGLVVGHVDECRTRAYAVCLTQRVGGSAGRPMTENSDVDDQKQHREGDDAEHGAGAARIEERQQDEGK